MGEVTLAGHFDQLLVRLFVVGMKLQEKEGAYYKAWGRHLVEDWRSLELMGQRLRDDEWSEDRSGAGELAGGEAVSTVWGGAGAVQITAEGSAFSGPGGHGQVAGVFREAESGSDAAADSGGDRQEDEEEPDAVGDDHVRDEGAPGPESGEVPRG